MRIALDYGQDNRATLLFLGLEQIRNAFVQRHPVRLLGPPGRHDGLRALRPRWVALPDVIAREYGVPIKRALSLMIRFRFQNGRGLFQPDAGTPAVFWNELYSCVFEGCFDDHCG